MGSKILPFIIGVVVGASAATALLYRKGAPTETVSGHQDRASLSNRIAELEATVDESRTRLTDAQSSNDRLTTAMQDLMKKQVPAATPSEQENMLPQGLAALFGGGGTNAFSQVMAEAMKSAIQDEVEGKMAGLKAKLNLTPEQETAIQAILGKEMSKGMEVLEKLTKGELSEAEMEKLTKDFESSERDQIAALLTPEQKKAYEEYEKEEKARTARLTANSELEEMQSRLQLTDEQQDRVFAVLYNFAQSESDGDNGSIDDHRKQADKKKEALRGVLTPDQLERYGKYQEQQIKLIEAFMPKGGVKANITVSPK
jgi:hypothetical protein